MDSSAAQSGEATRKAREWKIFLFLTVVLAPLLAVAVVGAYGFVVWIYQMFAGPPAS
jgi:nitrate reductase NapE